MANEKFSHYTQFRDDGEESNALSAGLAGITCGRHRCYIYFLLACQTPQVLNVPCVMRSASLTELHITTAFACDRDIVVVFVFGATKSFRYFVQNHHERTTNRCYLYPATARYTNRDDDDHKASICERYQLCQQ